MPAATEALPPLRAGGTLADVPAGAPGRRARLVAELAVLFVGAPLAVWYAIAVHRVPLFLVLPPVLVALLGFLLWDRTFHVTRELARGFDARELASILAVFLVAGGAVAAGVYLTRPDAFLAFPRYRPRLWAAVMVLYPLLSVLAQEFVYRTFFFHRYGPLFGAARAPAIAANGALFGLGHAMFGNWVAVLGSAALGALLAWRYERTRSIWAVCLEHTLYGWLVFTVGLGSYFFTGVSMWR
jgi:hypothetical protein